MRVFLDANILFSAAHREIGSVRIFFRLADAGLCELVSSPYASDEARRNVARKYPERLADLELLTTRVGVRAEAAQEYMAWALAQPLPANDVPILAAAAQAGVALLITGDRRDFRHLYGKTLRGIRVLPPVTAIEWLLGRME